MSKAKVVSWYNNRYKGSLSEDVCNILEQLIELDDSNGCVTDLRHIIYDLSDTAIDEILSYNFDWKYFKDKTNIDMHIGTLEDYQTVGVAYLYWAKRCLLGDSQGMGKTPISAGLCNLLRLEKEKEGKDFRFLFLAEKTSSVEIQRKLIKFTGDYVDLVGGDAKSSSKFVERNLYYPEYSVCGTHSLLKQGIFLDWLVSVKEETGKFPFDIIIVDESTVVGGSKTGYATSLSAIIKDVDNVVLLNATPFETSAKTMFNQIDLLDESFLPTKAAFSKEFEIIDYRGMFPRATGKYKNAETFKERCKYRYFARTRKAKGAVMEDCTGKKLVTDLSSVQKYWLQRSSLRQLVYDAPNYYDDNIEFCEENVPKLTSLRYVLEKECKNDDSVIVFTHYKITLASLSEWLDDMGISNRVLNGEVSDMADRQEIVKGFKEKQFRVLLTNVYKSLDFDTCDYCVFYSFEPNQGKMIQAEGRLERSFNIYGKHVYLLVSSGPELSYLKTVIKNRVISSGQFSNSDYSLISDIILGEEFDWDAGE